MSKIRECFVCVVKLLLFASFVLIFYITTQRNGCSVHGATKVKMAGLAMSIEAFGLDMKREPDSLAELLCTAPRCQGPYARQVTLIDGWRRPFLYLHDQSQGRAFLISLGRDGLPGGTKYDSDIFVEVDKLLASKSNK